jgi:hypothetical protein
MSPLTPPDDRPVTLMWITAAIERHERTVPFGTLRTYLDHARARTGRTRHPDYTRDLDLLKDTWLGVHESEILDYRHIRRITGHDLPALPRLSTFTVTVAGSERHDGEAGYTYALHAPDLATAKQLVLERHIAEHEEDIDLFTGEPRVPDVIVVEGPWDTFEGAPTWPADLPGRAWADLRTDADLLERAYLLGAAR